MEHRKLDALMTPIERIARVAAAGLTSATSSVTKPSGAKSYDNADGTRTIIGHVANGESNPSYTMATHVGDTTAPGTPTGVTASSKSGVVVVEWDGTLTGGIPDDFYAVRVYLDGSELGILTGAGSVSSASLEGGTTHSVTATAEDDACLPDGTPAHNVSAATAAISVTVSEGVESVAAEVEQVRQDVADFRDDVATTYATKVEREDGDEAVKTFITTNYTNSNDLATTYATKTLVSQTKDAIELAASQTYETQSDAAATYATKSALTVGLDGIRTEVAEDYQPKGDYATTASMNSAIQQSASSIESSVAATYETQTDAAATYATKTAVNGKADASDVTALAGRVTTAESNITQNATNINLKVSKNDVINQINLSTEGAKIQAPRVEIDGTAVFSAISSDVDSAITSKGYATTTQVATAKSEAISSANSSTDTKLQSYSTTAQANNLYDTKGAAAAVQTNLDNLEIGGRNLLATSGAAYSYPRAGTSGSYFIEFNVTNGWLLPYELEAGVEYTFSVDVTSSITPFAISVGAGTNIFQMDIASKQIASSGRASITFTPTANQLSLGKMFTFRVPRYSTSGTSFTYSVDRPKLEIGNKATDWSPAPEDIVSRTQRIWYRWNSATAPAAPTSWVTKGDDGSALWTKMHVAITSTHKYIYTCEQYEKADGTLGHTDVLLDNTITVIDGGNIITDSITANKLNASSINASKTLTVGAMTDAAAETILNSNVQVGGRNLLPVSQFINVSSGPDAITSDGYVTDSTPSGDGRTWSYANSNWHVYMEAGTYTISWETIVATTSTSQDLNVWGETSQLQEVRAYGTAFAEIGKKSITFNVPESGNYGVMMKVYGGKVRFKLEKGNTATDWSPAPEDVDASIAAVPRMAKISTHQRNFTTAQWQTYGAYGHVENWDYYSNSTYDNSHLRVGDTAYLTGTVSDGTGGSATIIGTVTAVTTTAVQMSSTQLVFGGDSVSNAAKTATNYIVADSSGIKIADANPASSTTYQHQTSSGTDFVVNGGVRNRVNADGMTLYDGSGVADSNIFAKFASQLIELGRNSINSIIKLCNGVGKISVETGTTTTMRIEAESTSEINAHTYISKSALDLAQAYGAAIGGFIFKDSISTANRLSYATVTARDTGQVEIDTQRDDGSTQHLQFDDSGLAINSTKGIRGINFGFSTGTTNSNGVTTFNPGMGVTPTAVFVSAGKASNETEAVAKIAVPIVWSIDGATQVQVRWQRSDTNAWLASNAVGWYWLAIY